MTPSQRDAQNNQPPPTGSLNQHRVNSSIVLKSLSILLGLFFIFIGAMKITPHLSKDLHKDLVSGKGVTKTIFFPYPSLSDLFIEKKKDSTNWTKNNKKEKENWICKKTCDIFAQTKYFYPAKMNAVHTDTHPLTPSSLIEYIIQDICILLHLYFLVSLRLFSFVAFGSLNRWLHINLLK